jgi:hypothetical protein
MKVSLRPARDVYLFCPHRSRTFVPAGTHRVNLVRGMLINASSGKAAIMNVTDPMKAVEERMNNVLHTYTHRSWSDTELQECLIDELRTTTIAFLELRSRSSPRQ